MRLEPGRDLEISRCALRYRWHCDDNSNALGALFDDAGTVTTSPNALGALSNSSTATNVSKALGALADTRTANTSSKALGALADTRTPNTSSKALGPLAVAQRHIRCKPRAE